MYSDDYAKFKFNFVGHVILGKIYGSANIVIQNGSIKNFTVVGTFGGFKYNECDIKAQRSIFTGKIKV